MDGLSERQRLPFAYSPLDRAGERRDDQAFLGQARSHPDAGLLVVAEGGRVPMAPDGALAWRSLDDDPGAESAWLLGVTEDGRPLFSRDAIDAEGAGAGPEDHFELLRDVGASLGDLDAAAAVEAVALSAWHRLAPYCPSCGSATIVEDAGHRRRCVACGTGQFPRSDPAVIMLVTAGDQCVLGRRVGATTANRWSTLAGFVEVGESLESAVAREVREEVGLTVHATRYRGSQPWPFPASLMLAFEADASFAPLTINDEHHEVRWFRRPEVASAIASGAMAVPPAISAGGFLIRSWLAAGSS